MNPYSVYDYLTFILPGATVIFVATYGWYGWPWGDPGASLLVGIIAAGFIAGNALAAAATWLEPVLLGAKPGSLPNVLWGQFAEGDRYAGRRDEIEGIFTARYGGTLIDAYRLAQIELRDKGKGEGLDRLTQQLGFNRGMAVAWLVSIILEVLYGAFWHTRLLSGLWVPLFSLLLVLYSYRFRRFWRWYGDYVIRNVLVMSRATEGD